MIYIFFYLFFFFNDTATTEIYTLSLHDALPISLSRPALAVVTIFTVAASRKDFLWPLLVLFNPEVQPLRVAIYHEARINSNFPLPFHYLIAGLVPASIPPILLYLLFPPQTIRGINL